MATTAVVSEPQYPASALPPAKGKAGLGGALRSEWTKLRTLRSTYWSLFVFAVIGIGLAAAMTAGRVSEMKAHHLPPGGIDATRSTLVLMLVLGTLVIAVFGALVITSEYSTGMIRTSLTAQPRRGVVYTAKTIVFTIVALIASMIVAFAAFYVGQAIFSSAGASVTLSHPYTLRAILGAALYVTAAGLFAFGVGAVVRHTAGAIAISVAVLFVFQILVNFLPQTWQDDVIRWLPTSSWEPLTATVGPQATTPHLFSVWPQFGVTVGWAVLLLIVGAFLLKKRDA